jgi:hypothetical protein
MRRAYAKNPVLHALDLLWPDQLAWRSGPGSLQAAVNERVVEQHCEQFWVRHLPHRIPERRCIGIDNIKEVVPL